MVARQRSSGPLSISDRGYREMRFCLLETPRLSAEVELDAGPEGKRQSRIAECLVIMLAE